VSDEAADTVIEPFNVAVVVEVVVGEPDELLQAAAARATPRNNATRAPE
jgi:hypothetical protein